MAVEQLPDSVVAFAPDGRSKVQEIIDAMAGDSATFAAAMIAWLGTLPTVEPASGLPYLNAGVLTVSNGP